MGKGLLAPKSMFNGMFRVNIYQPGKQAERGLAESKGPVGGESWARLAAAGRAWGTSGSRRTLCAVAKAA